MNIKQIRWPHAGEPEPLLEGVSREEVIEVLTGDSAFTAVHPVGDSMRIYFGPTDEIRMVAVTLARASDDSFMWRIRSARQMSTAEIVWWQKEIQK